MIFYLWIGTFYANVMNFDFVWEELGSLGVKVRRVNNENSSKVGVEGKGERGVGRGNIYTSISSDING